VAYWWHEQFGGLPAIAALLRHFSTRRTSQLYLRIEKAGVAFEAGLKNNVLKEGEVLDSLLYAGTR
jgi:hypothetical protein